MLFAVTDIETTGTQTARDGITEIAIILHDGQQVVDEYHSLVNPGVPIPSFIQKLTGINDEMVATAPHFYEVAKDIVQFTEGAVFVAHNVTFDYSFVKQQFHELGYSYNRPRLCTIRLARKLIPGLKKYGLSNVCKQLNIPLQAHHRAIEDARATAQLFGMLYRIDSGITQQSILDDQIKAGHLPSKLDPAAVNRLPEKPGIYYFHDQTGSILYVGKSTNIKKRVMSHFQMDYKTRKAIDFKASIADISYEKTGSELIALLLESHLIKKLQPPYNRAQRRSFSYYGLFHKTVGPGYLAFEIAKIAERSQRPLQTYSSRDKAKQSLFKITEKNQLCQKINGLFPTAGACFDFQVGQCKGACLHEEPVEAYNARAEQVLAHYQLGIDHFFVITQGRQEGEKGVVWVENGVYRGFGFAPEDQPVTRPEEMAALIEAYPDNRDTQQILRNWLRKNHSYRLWQYQPD